jgi:hypothetical protein
MKRDIDNLKLEAAFTRVEQIAKDLGLTRARFWPLRTKWNFHFYRPASSAAAASA